MGPLQIIDQYVEILLRKLVMRPELMKLLENYDPEAEVLLCTQEQWPFENEVQGVTGAPGAAQMFGGAGREYRQGTTISFMPDAEKLVGAGPGFLVAGALSIAVNRHLNAAITSLMGGILVAGGLLPVAGKGGLGGLMQGSGQMTIAAAVMVIGLAFQTVTHKDEEERLNEKAEAREKKARARDAAERAKRFREVCRKLEGLNMDYYLDMADKDPALYLD